MIFEVPPSWCGVYHLIRGDVVIYVGQTTNIFSRIGSRHQRYRTDPFDRIEFFPCREDELNTLEEEHIARYQPIWNSEGVKRPYRAPPWVRSDGSVCTYFGRFTAQEMEAVEDLVAGDPILTDVSTAKIAYLMRISPKRLSYDDLKKLALILAERSRPPRARPQRRAANPGILTAAKQRKHESQP
jgi:hypothetical protein